MDVKRLGRRFSTILVGQIANLSNKLRGAGRDRVSVEADRAIAAQIVARIVARLPEWFDGATLAVSLPEVQVRQWSFFLRYPLRTADGKAGAVLVKIPREPGITTLGQAVAAAHLAPVTRQEYETLQAMAAVFAGEGAPLGAIRPLVYLAEWNALVMEELPARPLKKLLLQPRMALGLPQDWQPFEAALASAGRWLRTFHEQLGERRTEPPGAWELRTEIERELGRLAPLDAAPLRVAFDRALVAVTQRPMPVATLHGDFNCANILVLRDGCVAALDPNDSKRGPIYLDLGTLVADLATRKVQVLSNGLFVRRSRLENCRAAVLEGYFGAKPADIQMLDLACALAVVRKWALEEQTLTRARGARRLAARAYAVLMRRYFSRLVRRYLRSDERERVDDETRFRAH